MVNLLIIVLSIFLHIFKAISYFVNFFKRKYIIIICVLDIALIIVYFIFREELF